MFDQLVAVFEKGGHSPKLLQLNKKDGSLTEYNRHHELEAGGKESLPSIKSRMFDTLKSMFVQFNHNKHLRFSGGAYNQYNDALYTVATVLDDKIAQDPAWSFGKFVMFRSNFTPLGIPNDSVFGTKFHGEPKGLVTYGGHLYTVVNGVVTEIDGADRIHKTVSICILLNDTFDKVAFNHSTSLQHSSCVPVGTPRCPHPNKNLRQIPSSSVQTTRNSTSCFNSLSPYSHPKSRL